MVQVVQLREIVPFVGTTLVEFEEPRFAFIEKRDSVRKEKIARIREQILQGTYQVSAADVAKAILRSEPSQVRRKKKDG